jgi:hypothetical protein
MTIFAPGEPAQGKAYGIHQMEVTLAVRVTSQHIPTVVPTLTIAVSDSGSKKAAVTGIWKGLRQALQRFVAQSATKGFRDIRKYRTIKGSTMELGDVKGSPGLPKHFLARSVEQDFLLSRHGKFMRGYIIANLKLLGSVCWIHGCTWKSVYFVKNCCHSQVTIP